MLFVMPHARSRLRPKMQSGQAHEAGSDRVEQPPWRPTSWKADDQCWYGMCGSEPEQRLARPGPGPRDDPVVAARWRPRSCSPGTAARSGQSWVRIGGVRREDGRVGLSLAREDGRDQSPRRRGGAAGAPDRRRTCGAAGELPAEGQRHAPASRARSRAPTRPPAARTRSGSLSPHAADAGGSTPVGERVEEGSRLGDPGVEVGGGQRREADRVGDAVELDAFGAQERGGRPWPFRRWRSSWNSRSWAIAYP